MYNVHTYSNTVSQKWIIEELPLLKVEGRPTRGGGANFVFSLLLEMKLDYQT